MDRKGYVFPVHCVPEGHEEEAQGFSMGARTILPHSVQEPS